MSTIFTTHPIKVNIISSKNVIKQTAIFVGIVPKEVRRELEKLQANRKPNPTVLSKFYGKDWGVKLSVARNKSANKNKKHGGDEFSFDGDNDIDIDIEPDVADEPKLDESKEQSEHPEEQPETPVVIDDMISLDDLDKIDEAEDHLVVKSPEQSVTQITRVESGQNLRFIFGDSFISVYPEDNVLDFKKKIYCALKIPIFRQHIWYVYQGRTYPLSYSIFQQNSLVYINVQEMLTRYNTGDKESMELIENLPVSTAHYKLKNYLKVTTRDTFSILDEYYHKYGITEYNLLDLDDFIAPSQTALAKIISERHQLELIYYSFVMRYWPMLSLSAFSEYMRSEANIRQMYPELHRPVEDLIHKFKLEKKIIDTKYDLINNPKKRSDLKKIQSLISNSIVQATISVLKYQNSKDEILFVRNLFDKFPLSDIVIGAKCHVTHNGKKVSLVKSYKQYPTVKDEIDLGSIIFKIRTSKDTTKTISLIVYQNGNYVIKSTWREEKQYDFSHIFHMVRDLVRGILDKINSFGDYVLSNRRNIPQMTKNNSKFTEIGMSMFYKKSLTQDQFTTLKSIMSDYRKAGIVRDRLIDQTTAEYYFSKGMYQFQPDRIEHATATNNYYDFLTDGVVKQKWHTIFEKTRITKLHHRFADIKIEIIGIKEKEFFIFYNFMLTLFEIFTNQVRSTPAKSKSITDKALEERRLKKSLRNLKEQDPVLYKYKKLYNTENIYSKICQKPYQPRLLSKQGYDGLPKNLKQNAVKYWNFTSNQDAYYSCPNPKYPYVKFITNRHPKNYCIPCCKKTKIAAAATDPTRIIYDICMKSHKYEQTERTITLGSRYIMSYGKDVEPGRLSRLPEHSMEPLFYETYSVQEPGIDPECSIDDGYYLYGVEQSLNGVHNSGVLNILMHAMELSPTEFITNIIKLMKATPNKFRILLNGKINKHFRNMAHFIEIVSEIYLKPNPINTYSDIPWNLLFINIAYLFLNINVINFSHAKSDNVRLKLPSYITSKEQFLSPEFQNLLVFRKKDKYYPIYLLNTDIFFKLKVVTKKLFAHDAAIVIIVSKLVQSHFNKQVKGQLSNNINLSVLSSFVKESKYTINKLFINSANMCYCVHLSANKSPDVYLPIELSPHLISEKIQVTYDMFSRKKHKMSIDILLKFTKEFNHWVAVKSEEAGMLDNSADKSLPLEKRVQPIYPYIEIKQWLLLAAFGKPTGSAPVIGFVCNNINYYTTNISQGSALKLAKSKFIQVMYDPDEINKFIFTKTRAIMDQRCNKIGKSVYNSNLYQLVLLEFMTLFNRQKNNTLRQKIKKGLLGNLNQNFDDIMAVLADIVCDCDDYNKIKSQVCEFINTHHNKNTLFDEIDDTFYKFDREIFEKVKKLPKDKLYNELLKLSNKFVVYGDISKIKNFEFPNMFISCQSGKMSNTYCKKSKLIIEKKTLQKLLEIMAADITNPAKAKWLFSDVFSGNNISFYKFIRRPNESISIEVFE